MGNDYFEDILKRMYQNTCDSYNQLGSSSNQTIGDIIKSLTEQSDKYYEELQIDEVKFQITPKGELDVHITGQTTLNTLQELRHTVNLYRKSYKVMIETSKQLKLLGDF